MKFIKYSALLTTVMCYMIFGSSCKKNLEEKPYSSQSAGEVFSSEAGLKKATLGVYQTFTNSPYTTFYHFGLTESGDKYCAIPMFTDPFFSTLNNFTLTSSGIPGVLLDQVWIQDYQVIARANTVIGNANLAVSDTVIANKYIAEARFLRAYAYFDLVRLFGGVPIIDKQITSLTDNSLIYGSRATIQQVYDFIVADMLYANSELPDTWTGADLGRATAATSKAMLGKVYLTMAGKPLNATANYQKAIDILNEVVGANEAKYNLSLQNTFASVFSEANKRNSEILLSFSVFYSSTNTQASVIPFYTEPFAYASGDEQTFYGISYKLFQLYGSGDTRRDETLVSRYKAAASGANATAGDSIIYNPTRLKYIDTVTHNIVGAFDLTIDQGLAYAKYDRSPRPAGSGASGYQTDYIVLRFSDVLLCLAEAEIETGDLSDAQVLINRVRTRAGAAPYTDLNDMEDRVRLERRLELTGEHNTVFDIRRWGTLQSEIAATDPRQVTGYVVGTYNQKFELYPIPLAEINVNPNLKQNPGF